MAKRVLDVGQCQPDHSTIRRLVQGQFGAEVVQAHELSDTLARLRSEHFDLVLVNRKLDIDYSDGMEVIRQIKADPEFKQVPVMLVSNYRDWQAKAVAEGAEPGFGKAQCDDPKTHARLAQYLA